MSFLAGLLANVITLLIIIFFARAIASWLFVFGVRNEFVSKANEALSGITEPIIAPIRRYVPPMGGLDLSYMIVVLVLVVIRRVLSSI